ncbi:MULTISPECIES: carbohydrate ABC transporter permease [unclassified Paenibacillus]|uniref:carbohydrate ABC transporter permease n=1 Tax=unclassified Paenibacillus TaxID=185978 RepID=UPI002F41F884
MKETTGADRIFTFFNTILMLLLIVVTLYPIYHVVMASLSDSNRLIAHQGPLLAPLGFSLEAYMRVLKNPNIFSGYLNTFIVLFAGTFVNLLFTALGAYGLSRKFMLRKPIMLAIIFTMYFSGGLIPTYLLINNWLQMGNNLLALIIPVAVSTWNLIIMRTSFEALPESLIESAKIDGSGEFGILFRIVVPLSMPVIAVMILYYGVAHWNSWFNAMLFIRSRELFPLQIILREILIINDTNSMQLGDAMADQEGIRESIKYATIIVATLPILLIYPFLQRFFAKGVMIGAVKE